LSNPKTRNNLVINPDKSTIVLCAECLSMYTLGEDHELYKAGASSKCECCEVTKDKN